MVDQRTVYAARENGSVATGCHGERPSVDEIVDLLVDSSRFERHVAVRINSNKLLKMMAESRWFITAGSHQTDRGNETDDKTNHYTVSFGRGRSYHLRHDARGHLFEITGPGLLDLAPWAAPGTDVMASGKQG